MWTLQSLGNALYTVLVNQRSMTQSLQELKEMAEATAAVSRSKVKTQLPLLPAQDPDALMLVEAQIRASVDMQKLLVSSLHNVDYALCLYVYDFSD